MENKPKQIQQMSPLMPNSGQIRELRLTIGKEKAAEWLEKIMAATMAKYHFEKLMPPAHRLSEIMKRQGITQGKLSELTGISTASLSGYWQGHRPRRRFQTRIALALGVTPNEIWGDGEPEAERRS